MSDTPHEQKPYRIEYHFKQYLDNSKLDPKKMPKVQLEETKRAFWAAWGQCQLQTLGHLQSKTEANKFINLVQDQVKQVSSFFAAEATKPEK